MKKAAIAIGVDKPSSLPPLSGAVAGAKDFGAWAEKQGFEVQVITDEKDPVNAAQIKNAVKRRCDGSYSQIFIYFAGHGFAKDASSEFWLLSDVGNDANEAVNLWGSIALARNTGAKHFVFISDACRSRPDSDPISQVTGSVIFPNNSVRKTGPAVDIFYATRLGKPALEAKDAAKEYKGLFTECLLDAIRKHSDELAESANLGSEPCRAISAHKLKDYLDGTLADLASSVDIKLSQDPDIRPESQFPPLYFCLLPSPLPGADQAAESIRRTPIAGLRTIAGYTYDLDATGTVLRIPSSKPRATVLSSLAGSLALQSFFPGPAKPSLSRTQKQEHKILLSEVKDLLKLKEPSVETPSFGFAISVHGAKVERAWVTGGFCEIGNKGEVQVHTNAHRASVLIRFRDGFGTCLAVVPGFIASVVIQANEIVTVNYTPAPGSPRWSVYRAQKEDVDKRRAFAAIASRSGYLRIEPENAYRFAGFLRELKALDPTLGIYASYGYSQCGLRDQCVSVYEFMAAEHDLPVLFDIALLAGKLGPKRPAKAKTKKPMKPPAVAPFCPMLTQGWALLTPIDKFLPAPVREAGRFLKQSLWTLLRPQGVELLSDAIVKGALQ